MSFRFYVIGSNSFSGACFIKYLLERGYQVSGCSRSLEPHKVLLPYKWLKDHNQFSFNKIDLNQKLDTNERTSDRGDIQVTTGYRCQG